MCFSQLINRSHPLCKGYIPDDLTEVCFPFAAPLHSQKRFLRYEAALWAKKLFQAAQQEEISLYGISGFRSYETQEALFLASSSGMVAPPGSSEHQSGLALDVSSLEISLVLEPCFADTEAGKWLHRHAPLYGFILRYPKGKEEITQIPYEPWHIRYVTKPLALYLTLTGLTLEEYHQIGDRQT